MVYTGDLKSPVERHAGSSPAPGTINNHTYPTPTRYGRLCSSTEDRFKSMIFNSKIVVDKDAS